MEGGERGGEPSLLKLLLCSQDIMEIRNYLHVLNGKTAAATALILYNLGSAGVLGQIM